jgi:hypothetical protein
MTRRRDPPTKLYHTLYWTVLIKVIFEKYGDYALDCDLIIIDAATGEKIGDYTKKGE